jgi:hypothetical protein
MRQGGKVYFFFLILTASLLEDVTCVIRRSKHYVHHVHHREFYSLFQKMKKEIMKLVHKIIDPITEHKILDYQASI